MWAMDSGEPMNMKRHSGGTTDIMWAYRTGRWGSGRVSTRKASFVRSRLKGGAGVEGAKSAAITGSGFGVGAAEDIGITECEEMD